MTIYVEVLHVVRSLSVVRAQRFEGRAAVMEESRKDGGFEQIGLWREQRKAPSLCEFAKATLSLR